MSRSYAKGTIVVFLFTLFHIAAASAENADNTLTRLLPSSAEVITGISRPGLHSAHGRLLLDTRENDADLDACLSLLGPEFDQSIEQAVVVARSTSTADLGDHLLLIRGLVDRNRLYRAAIQRGGSVEQYQGQRLVTLKITNLEASQEKQQLVMSVVGEQVLLLGTRLMVEEAINRYTSDASSEPSVLEGLREVPSNATSWSIVTMHTEKLARHLSLLSSTSDWTQALGTSSRLVVGIHYGRTDRISFTIHAGSMGAATELAAKIAPAKMVAVGLSQDGARKSIHVSVMEGTVTGSVTIPSQDLERWLQTIARRRESDGAPPQSETSQLDPNEGRAER